MNNQKSVTNVFQRLNLHISHLAIMSICLAFVAPSQAASEADLKWDLSYKSALKANPIAQNEFMQIWASRYPSRPIHTKLGSYAGEPIEASLLIETPDGHTGDPSASWFIKTRSTVTLCEFHPKYMNKPCRTLDPSRVENFIREVMRFKKLPPQLSEQNVIEKAADGKTILLNYMGYLSVYVDGKSLQRPIALLEWGESNVMPGEKPDPETGRLGREIAKLMLSDADFKKRQIELDAHARQQLFDDAVRRGDLEKMRTMLDTASSGERNISVDAVTRALVIAAQNGQQRAVDFLLTRGAKIDANESAALKAAVQADDLEMIKHLLDKGAQVDPPKESLNSYGMIYQSALGLAVRLHKEQTARLLIGRGADVNINQSPAIVASAVIGGDLAIADLILGSGAKPDQVTRDDSRTALMSLMMDSGALSGWPQDPEQQKAILKREAGLEAMVRRLVLAGANVNFITSTCYTAYQEASNRHSEGMKNLLVSLGADANLQQLCIERQKQGAQGSTSGTEATARASVATEAMQYLRRADYQNLEVLYEKLKKPDQRTPSGIWKLAIFYNQLRDFSQRKRDPVYWNTMQLLAQDWQKKFPQSVPARIFQVYLYWNRVIAYRGVAAYSTLNAADKEEVASNSAEALKVLAYMKANAASAKDPEWYRAMLNVLPYSKQYSAAELDRVLAEGMQLYPNYHEMYFAAGFFSLSNWSGNPNAVEKMAKRAKLAPGNKEKRSMYARIYWYLNQVAYQGKIFELSHVDWAEMSLSFSDLVALYPDPWNLNAYAYFACQAQDYATMKRVLKQIDKQLIFIVWGEKGYVNYDECTKQVATNAGKGVASENTQKNISEKRLQRIYNDFIWYGSRMRSVKNFDESLKALHQAEDIYRNSMMTQYNLGSTLMDMHRYSDAITAFSLGIVAQPDYAQAYWQRGLAYEALGRKVEARKDFESGAKYLTQVLPTLDPKMDAESRQFFRTMQDKFRQYGFDTPRTF